MPLWFTFSKLRRIWSVHVVVLQRTAKKCTKMYNAHAKPLYCSLNLLFSHLSVLVSVVVCLNSLKSKAWLPSQLFLVNLTSFHNVGHRDSKRVAHVTHHSKYYKTSEDTRATVDKGNNQRIPMEWTMIKNLRLHMIIRANLSMKWTEISNDSLWQCRCQEPISCQVLK